MRLSRTLKRNVVPLVCIGLMVSPAQSFGATSTTSASAPKPGIAVDVALRDGGQLVGTIIDDQGDPIHNYAVNVKLDRHVVASTMSDEHGKFSVRGLRSGVHSLSTRNGDLAVRLWTEKSAPPRARDEMLLRAGGPAVRGQGPVAGPYGGCTPECGGCATCSPCPPLQCIDPLTYVTLGIAIAALVVAVVRVNNNSCCRLLRSR